MTLHNLRRFSFILTFSLFTSYVFSQSLAKAKELYQEGNYEEAKPAFARLVKQSPSNSSYNHWYGVCCYETNELELAEKHLLVANKRKVKESYRYLGDLYYQTYRFEEAIEMYTEYVARREKSKEETEEWETKIRFSEDAQRMMNNTQDVVFIDSVSLPKSKMLDVYKLSAESGRLLSYEDYFETMTDFSSTVYINQKGNKIYYSRPNDGGQLELCTRSKLLDSWDDEDVLSDIVNRGEDAAFPYVLSDGVTIYFASRGNESIGGYDLFVTRYNTNTDEYLAPNQLGMPFNSIYNDYMMVIDESKNLGWLVSDRYQTGDSVCVYLFKPQPSYHRLEELEPQLQKDRAMLTSINDTWQPDSVDYQSLITLAYKKSEIVDEMKGRDFIFVIKGNTVYYNLEDIKSAEAKDLYQKYLNEKEALNSLRVRLEKMRTDYIAQESKRGELSPAILSAEKELKQVSESHAKWEKMARNVEIKHLGLNK